MNYFIPLCQSSIKLGLGLVICLFLSTNAAANCSRTLQVPLLPSGLTVIVQGNNYSGILPDFLAQVSAKSGCKISYQLVPKSRQENMFENAQADLLITAAKTSRRDQFGIFVPLVQLRASLISIEHGQPSIQSLKDLLQHSQLKLAVVRGFDYGPTYQAIIDDMQKSGRLQVENDTVSIARTMRNNPNYVTIMAPTIFAGAIQTERKLNDLNGRIRYEKLEELPWTESGIYISTLSLNEADRNLLKVTMEKLTSGESIWKAYQQYYSSEVIKLGLRPRESPLQ